MIQIWFETQSSWTDENPCEVSNSRKLISFSLREYLFADDETANLKTDDAHFPWGIGGTTQFYALYDLAFLKLGLEELKVSF
jgi:hypothetical protein